MPQTSISCLSWQGFLIDLSFLILVNFSIHSFVKTEPIFAIGNILCIYFLISSHVDHVTLYPSMKEKSRKNQNQVTLWKLPRKLSRYLYNIQCTQHAGFMPVSSIHKTGTGTLVIQPIRKIIHSNYDPLRAPRSE